VAAVEEAVDVLALGPRRGLGAEELIDVGGGDDGGARELGDDLTDAAGPALASGDDVRDDGVAQRGDGATNELVGRDEIERGDFKDLERGSGDREGWAAAAGREDELSAARADDLEAAQGSFREPLGVVDQGDHMGVGAVVRRLAGALVARAELDRDRLLGGGALGGAPGLDPRDDLALHAERPRDAPHERGAPRAARACHDDPSAWTERRDVREEAGRRRFKADHRPHDRGVALALL
jgi:hypothetical protein